jgi:hypothetical protein
MCCHDAQTQCKAMTDGNGSGEMLRGRIATRIASAVRQAAGKLAK